MFITQIYFVLTRRCNLFCDHCIRSSGPGLEEELSFDSAKKTLENLSKYYKSANLLLSGGEPTLHKNFVEIAEISSRLFDNVTINTNGLRHSFLEEAILRGRGNLGVQISIDGDATSHNKIRGKGTFERTIQTIKKIPDNVHLTIATTVTKNNIHTLPSLDSYLQNIPFDSWTLQREVLYGRASLSSEKVHTAEWNSFVKTFKKNSLNQKRIVIGTMFDFTSLFKMKSNSGMNCGTFRTKFYINPDLTVFPCGCLEEQTFCDLSKEDSSVILERMKRLSVSPNKESPCKKCPFLKVCNGGCPGASYNYFQQYGVGDPRCPAINDLLIRKGIQ